MQLISDYNRGFQFLPCAIDIFHKYACVVPLKEISGHKSNKILVDEGCKFYSISMKSWLQGNGMGIYSTYSKGKSIVTKRFIRTLRNKIYKYMT